jgi:hypothetical protein
MRTLVKLTLAVTLAIAVSACGDFLDINESPNAATEPPANNIFPSSLVSYAQNQTSEIGWQHAYHAQTWADPNVFVNAARYRIGGFALGNTWAAYYTTGSGDLKTVQDVAAEQGNIYASAQARITRQIYFLDATSIWERVPYTQAAQVERFPNPEFDDQETVLSGIIANVDTAITQLESAGGGQPVTSGDFFYGGDTDQWIKLANAIKMKAAFMLQGGNAQAEVNGTLVSEIINDLVDLPDSETMRSFSDNALIPYPGDGLTSSNPVWQLHARYNNEIIVPGFFESGAALVDMMNNLDDPRRDVYFARVDRANDLAPNGEADNDDGPNADSSYVGGEPGVITEGNLTSYIGDDIIVPDWPVRVFTADEYLLYEAEALLLQDDPSGAQSKLEAGIRANMNYLLARTERSDVISSDAVDTYIDNLTDLTTVSQSEGLEVIHQQQYIALFDRGTDVWVQQRRTGVPQISLPQGAALPGIIARWPYPGEVRVNNPNTPDDPLGSEDMFFQGG